MNIYITKELVDDVEFSELDIAFKESFGFNYDEMNDLIEIQTGYGDADGISAPIDMIIQALQSMKDKGATHVEMNYHCDHYGYEISGYKITPSTPEQIAIYEDKIKISTEKQKADRIAALYAEIKKLEV